MKNRLLFISLIAAASLTLSACAEGTLPAGLSENLEGIETIEIEVSGEGSSAAIDEIEVTGVVSMMSDSAWTIGGQTFLITPQTEIKGALEIGDLAKVHAFLSESGEVFAREIEPAEDNDPDSDEDGGLDDDLVDPESNGSEIEFVGVVESIADPTWVIAGREVKVVAQTEVNGVIADGMLVKVHAVFVEGEGLVAREIEPVDADDLDEDDLDDDRDLKFEGVVESIDEESVVIGGITFYFAEFTEFEDEISVGDSVEVYFLDQDGTNVVREIELEDMDDELDELDDLDDESDDDDLDDDFDDDNDDDDDDDHDEGDDD
ncbi:MAG: DUF5666 domain-containing protein [Anaerolineales bacterium]|nr:DUF5666 domain-containing protein [Anaerolineales bacterium]